MQATTPAPRRVARAIAIALWAVGSATLIKTELIAPEPDYVVIAATPVVWLAVIILPILSSYALRERQWLAGALLALAALVGSAYTLTGTLSRSSEARDARIARAEAQSIERRRITDEREEAAEMLEQSQKRLARECSTGRGDRCKGIEATVSVYTAAVAGHDAALAKLTIESPAAGERRVAAALAALPWANGDAADYAEAVGLWMPALLGLVLEVGALATAMFGWHGQSLPRRRDSFQTSFAGFADPAMFAGPQGSGPRSGPQNPGPKGGNRCRQPLPATVTDLAAARFSRRQGSSDQQRQALLDALAEGPTNNRTLAARMGVSEGEATRRRQDFSELVNERQMGRELRIALR